MNQPYVTKKLTFLERDRYDYLNNVYVKKVDILITIYYVCKIVK